MVSIVAPDPDIVALLSAASIGDAGKGGNEGALQRIAGQSLLGCQMLALKASGVSKFLIEVDNVPGELLHLADTIRHHGAAVDFVRSTIDLRKFLKPEGRLLIQAEAHYFSTAAIGELMLQLAPFVAVVDGRDDNAAFERIDLNTRWVGFAVLDAPMALSMDELPPGWSITSSLLRHAIQNNVRLQKVAQADLQRGEIARVASPADADKIVGRMLSDRTERSPGFIERILFGNIAKRIAPTIWDAHNGAIAVGVTRFISAFASIGFAAMGWSIAAALGALFTLFMHSIYGVVQCLNESGARQNWQNKLLWLSLVASFFIVAWTNADYGSDTLAFVTVVTGLALLGQKMNLPRWAAGVLQSPALLAAALLLSAILSEFSVGTKILALTQLAALVAALYLPRSTGKNRNHA